MSESPKKKGPPKPSPVMAVVVALVLIALCFAVPKIGEWSAERERAEVRTEKAASERRATSVTTRSMRARSEDLPVVSDEWHRVTLPQGDADWPSWIQVPLGHTITFCDPVNDPGCSAKDFSNVRYHAQCRSLTDGQPRDQESGECTWTDAYRMRAKGSDPMPLLYRFKRAS